MKTKTLGMTIAELRKKQGMTQLELANKMGVTDKAVSKWERDLSCPDINSFPHLAEVFNVSVDELLQSKTDSEKPEQASEVQNVIALILKVIPLAMGVAVVVLSALKQIDMYSGFSMLGIGMFCIALNMMTKKDN